MNPYLKKSVVRALESDPALVVGLPVLAVASAAMVLGNAS